MADQRPPKKKCSATSRQTGNRCGQWARPGHDVCVYHGAGKPGGRRSGAPIKHGRYSIRLRKGNSPTVQRRIDELMDDDDLTDARRAVAVSQVALEQTYPAPTLATLKRFCEGEGITNPAPGDLETMAQVLIAQAGRQAAQHGRLQVAAEKQRTMADVLVSQAMPIMRRHAMKVTALMRRFIPESRAVEFEGALQALNLETAAEYRNMQGED